MPWLGGEVVERNRGQLQRWAEARSEKRLSREDLSGVPYTQAGRAQATRLCK
jgi:hypothetical protein